MATFVSVGTPATDFAGTTGTRNMVPALPTGATAGDLLLLVVFFRNNANSKMPAVTGWTKLDSAGTSSGSLGIYWRVMVGGDSAPSVGVNDTTLRACQIVAFRGINPATPIGGIGWTAPDTGSSQDIGPITGGSTAATGEPVIVIGFKRDDWTSVADLTGDSLTWHEIDEQAPRTDFAWVWDYAIAGAPGSIGNKTFTVTGGTSFNWLGEMVSLKPSATVSRTAAISAATSIATVGTVIAGSQTITRSAAISAATSIASSGSFWTTFTRTTALSAATSIASSASFWTTFTRTVDINAASSVSSTGTFWTTFTRSAALSAASSVTAQATFWSTLTRQTAISAATSIASDGYSILARSAALSASTSITSSGTTGSIISASASLSAASSIAATGFHRHHRSAALTAQSSVSTVAHTVHYRSATVTATTSLDTAPQRELLRSVVISAITDIQAGGTDIELFTRSVSLSATTAIGSAGDKVLAWNYHGGTLASYSGGNDFTYLAGTASTYGPNPDWSYGGTASPTYTYGG